MIAADAKRMEFADCRGYLDRRWGDFTPGDVILLSGPRQTGKTKILRLLARQVGAAGVYVCCESEEAGEPGFLEHAGEKAGTQAAEKGRAILLLDEVHLLPDWAGRLHAMAGVLRRRRTPVLVVASSSSALDRTFEPVRDILVHFERICLSHWTARGLVRDLALDPEFAVELCWRTGCYPAAVSADPPGREAFLRGSILEPVLERDIPGTAPVRRPNLLRQVLEEAVTLPASLITLQELQARLGQSGAGETIAHYLELLEDTFILAILQKYPGRETHRRPAPLKLVILNNALLGLQDPGSVPDEESDPSRFRAWVENACLAHACNAGQRVTYWRDGHGSVDGVIEGTWGAWAIAVVAGDAPSPLSGLSGFIRRYPGFRPLVLCPDGERTSDVECMSWRSFLLHGPPEPHDRPAA